MTRTTALKLLGTVGALVAARTTVAQDVIFKAESFNGLRITAMVAKPPASSEIDSQPGGAVTWVARSQGFEYFDLEMGGKSKRIMAQELFDAL